MNGSHLAANITGKSRRAIELAQTSENSVGAKFMVEQKEGNVSARMFCLLLSVNISVKWTVKVLKK